MVIIPREVTSILLQMMHLYIRCNLLGKKIIIYLNVNKMPIINFENIHKLYLKYDKNIPLFHSILKTIVFPNMLPKNTKSDLPMLTSNGHWNGVIIKWCWISSIEIYDWKLINSSPRIHGCLLWNLDEIWL
jgi:hypothetical protein